MIRTLTIATAFFFAHTLLAETKPLAERVVTLNTKVDYDEAYNEALEEMQNLNDADKSKLSKDLEKILVGDKIADRRANAATALGDLCGAVKTNDAILAKATNDKEKIVRQAITSGITRCGATTTSIKVLKGFLKDKDETVKVMAEGSLEKFGTPEAKAALKSK